MQAVGVHSVQLENLDEQMKHVPFSTKYPTAQVEQTVGVHVKQFEYLELQVGQAPAFK